MAGPKLFNIEAILKEDSRSTRTPHPEVPLNFDPRSSRSQAWPNYSVAPMHRFSFGAMAEQRMFCMFESALQRYYASTDHLQSKCNHQPTAQRLMASLPFPQPTTGSSGAQPAGRSGVLPLATREFVHKSQQSTSIITSFPITGSVTVSRPQPQPAHTKRALSTHDSTETTKNKLDRPAIESTVTSSASKHNLSTHKKYRCDACGKAFSRSNTLVTHKRIHTGEKPFHCEQCGRSFRQPGNLTRHRLTHTTEKPFRCVTCGKSFNRVSNLQTHSRVHGDKSEEGSCSECINK